jgi:hypothetical protein
MNIVIETLIHNGVGYSNLTPDELKQAGVPADVVDAAVRAIENNQARDQLRAEIAAKAGDVESLLGTVSDVAALSLIGMMQLAILISEKGSADMKAGLAALPIPMPLDKAKALIAAIGAGKVKVPALVKGVDVVLAEVAARATATADVLIDAKAKA